MHYVIILFIALLLILYFIGNTKEKKLPSENEALKEAAAAKEFSQGRREETQLIHAEAEDDLEVGSTIDGRYQVINKLGKGGMGQVYLCKSISMGNLWAIKLIQYNKAGQHFPIVEEDILKRLNHIYLPKIVEVLYTESGAYIVESYIEGTPLDKKMAKEGPFDEEQVINWGIQLLEVLEYLHSMKPRPIIYNDMKPSNIIITHNNVATLIDFGISKELNSYSPGDSSQWMAYTAAYAAPEQLRGISDQTTDFYSLGLMLLFLLTNLETDDIKHGDIKGFQISKSLREALLRAIAVRSEERYQTAEEFKETLKEIKFNQRSQVKYIKELPADYKKIIGIYSPYAIGKTTVACNLASAYAKKGISVALIDTDSEKKDIQYHFDIESPENYQRLKRLERDIEMDKEIHRLEDYYIKRRGIEMYTDHRDSSYSFSYSMLKAIIKNTDANVIIIDIARGLDKSAINKMLSSCNDRLLIIDKTMSNILGLPSRLKGIEASNYRNMSLVINKDVAVKGITEKEVLGFLEEVEVFGAEAFSITFKHVYKVPDKYKALVGAMLQKSPSPLYGKDKEFDAAIDELGEGLYQINARGKRQIMAAFRRIIAK